MNQYPPVAHLTARFLYGPGYPNDMRLSIGLRAFRAGEYPKLGSTVARLGSLYYFWWMDAAEVTATASVF